MAGVAAPEPEKWCPLFLGTLQTRLHIGTFTPSHNVIFNDLTKQ